jgi:hypothetical protein
MTSGLSEKCRYYRHRRHTLDLKKLDGLFGAFEVIHRNIESLIMA